MISTKEELYLYLEKNKQGLCSERSEIFYGKSYQRIIEHFP